MHREQTYKKKTEGLVWRLYRECAYIERAHRATMLHSEPAAVYCNAC